MSALAAILYNKLCLLYRRPTYLLDKEKCQREGRNLYKTSDQEVDI